MTRHDPDPWPGVHDERMTKRRVRVWFGSEVICSHAADPGEAERYAKLMAQRFAGLTVTIDDQPGAKDQGLPHELLWEQTVR